MSLDVRIADGEENNIALVVQFVPNLVEAEVAVEHVNFVFFANRHNVILYGLWSCCSAASTVSMGQLFSNIVTFSRPVRPLILNTSAHDVRNWVKLS